MNVQIDINNSNAPGARFLTWAPSPCRVRVTNPAGSPGPTTQARITRVVSATGGSVEFALNPAGPYSASINLNLPTNGTSVPFFTRGVFGRPSPQNLDVQIRAEARVLPNIAVFTPVGSVQAMVRVRKNANNLTPAERTRLVAAFAQLNNQGLGRFADFRDMHVNQSVQEAHGLPGFLPWHRSYLLDLERELQAIDPSVALPYWRFDQPAPTIFALDFLGVSNQNGNVQFAANNPLQFWRTDNVPGIVRRPLFPTNQAPPGLRSEAATLGLGPNFSQFMALEGNPHGSAHVSFGGFISSIGTAARDPLFFLLHCNVDRLWAKWQKANGRFDIANAASYAPVPGNRIGHNLPDTMWPWNGVTTAPRPPFAPGGQMATSPCVTAPGPSPRVRDNFDYQGSLNVISRLGFSYDDVA